MARPTAARSFAVGETVHLRSRVSLPGTRTPTDPAIVELTSLARDGVETLAAAVPLVREGEGEYALSLTTTDLTPGVYTLTVTHSDGPSKVALATDGFVLEPA